MSESLVNSLFFCKPWAIHEDLLMTISGVLMRHESGDKLTLDEIQARIGNAGTKQARSFDVVDGTAYIQIYGVISKKISLLQNISGGTSIEAIRNDIALALADEKVKQIVLDIDSPGGNVDGIPELADFIKQAGKQKPLTAYTDGQMCSAAYWLGAAAGKIVASKSAQVGSIGVYSVIRDYSVAEHQRGIKTQIVKAGKFKAMGHPSKPMTEDDAALAQEAVNDYFSMFVSSVGKFRGLAGDALDNVATGRTWIAKKALELKLIDRVDVLDNILACSSRKTIPAVKTSNDCGTPAANISKDPACSVPVSLQSGVGPGKAQDAEALIPKDSYKTRTELYEFMVKNNCKGKDDSPIPGKSFDEFCSWSWERDTLLRKEFSSKESFTGYLKAIRRSGSTHAGVFSTVR
jgi:Periplasmic serine proteases (ClpP class)